LAIGDCRLNDLALARNRVACTNRQSAIGNRKSTLVS
jgi:hypothetical protein